MYNIKVRGINKEWEGEEGERETLLSSALSNPKIVYKAMRFNNDIKCISWRALVCLLLDKIRGICMSVGMFETFPVGVCSLCRFHSP